MSIYNIHSPVEYAQIINKKLTLRGQRDRCKKLNKNSLTEGHAYFSSGCSFMVGLGKPKLWTKFESLVSAIV